MAIFDIEDSSGAKIKVVGVGGGGGNAVNRMIEYEMFGVDFILMNTDSQVLERSPAAHKLQIGSKLTKGLGAGANPEIGRESAEEEIDAIRELVGGVDMVFITAGMGGGTGTGASPVIARVAKETGALVVGVVTKPFFFEGKRRMQLAEEGLWELKEAVDSIIIIPNQRLINVTEKDTTFTKAFDIADMVLYQAVKGISDLITIEGFINLDFADVKTVMSKRGTALMGTGIAKGEKKAIEATKKAISSPLLEDRPLDGARAVLLNITGGEDLTLHEINEASTLINETANEDANIIFGTVRDPSMKDEIRITVIATGFDEVKKEKKAVEDLKKPIRFHSRLINDRRPSSFKEVKDKGFYKDKGYYKKEDSKSDVGYNRDTDDHKGKDQIFGCSNDKKKSNFYEGIPADELGVFPRSKNNNNKKKNKDETDLDWPAYLRKMAD